MENKLNIKANKQAGFFVSLFCIFVLFACSEKGKIIATVDDIPLYEEDVYLLMKHQDYDLTDSILFKETVDRWCTHQSFINELKTQNSEAAKINQLRAHSFLGDLSMFEIEKMTTVQELDTIIDEKEINEYYDKNKEEFILHDYIVKALYLKIPKEVDFKKKNIHQYYLLKKDKDILEIDAFAKNYAENYYFNDSSWIFFNELAKDIPISKYNVDNIILNRTKTYFSDENYTYLINIIDFKLKNEVPPIDFLRNDIQKIILNKRLLEITKNNESKLIQRIKKKHEININY